MSKPTIFTYYEQIPTWNVQKQLSMWRTNWQRAGFRAVVLGRDVAKRHPLFGKMVDKTRGWFSLNDRRYEEACYVRWCAFAVMVGMIDRAGLMSDYDVVNNGFSAAHMGNPLPVVCHESTRVPCLMQATHAGAEEIVNFILSRDPPPSEHYSDMIAVKESNWPITGMCVELGTPGWQQAPAIHIASGAVQRAQPGADKTQFIASFLKY